MGGGRGEVALKSNLIISNQWRSLQDFSSGADQFLHSGGLPRLE